MSALLATGMALGTALIAGAAVVPATRRLVVGDINRDWLAGELDLDNIHADRMTFILKNGDHCRAIALDGIAYDARSTIEVGKLAEARAAIYGMLGNADIRLRLFVIKRRRDISYDAKWPAGALTEIGRAEANHYQASFDLSWYLLLQSSHYGRLVQQCERLLAVAVDYGAYILRQPDDKADPCPLTSFINYLICGEMRDDLSASSHNLSAALPAADLDFKQDGSIVTQIPISHIQRIIAIRSWPESISGEILGALLMLQSDMEVCQICLPIGKTLAQAMFARKAREINSLAFISGGDASEFEDAISVLGQEETALFETQFQITIRTGSKAEMDDILTAAGQILGRNRVSFSIETTAAASAWFNRIPGHEKLIRPLKLFSGNLAAIWPFHNAPSGAFSNPWGDLPVRLFGTESGQSYAFQYHVSDEPQAKGHYLVLGGTGAGKTTLQMHLAGGLSKFDGVRSYIFDSREGARYMIEAMGGLYQSFENLSLNPLDGHDTPAFRHRINLLIRAMLGEHGHNDDVDEVIERLLSYAFSVDCPDRTLSNVFSYAFETSSETKRTFSQWVKDDKGKAGLYAHVFNAPHDTLATVLDQSHIVGINMNETLRDPVLGPPVVAHIAATISESAAKAGRGFNIFIDEGANLISNDGFKQVVMEMFREYRKLNGVVGIAFQDPAALHRSGIAEAVIENTATLIIFPNRYASKVDYEAFNLNEEHMSFITGRREGRKVLVIKRDGSSGLDESAILDVDLSWLGDGLRYYRSGGDANAAIAALQQAFPDDWQGRL